MLIGLVASLWLALIPTLHQGEIGHVSAKALLDRKEDMYYLYTAASNATWSDIPKWWVGPWNWPGVPYYRPITSTLLFIECRLFGDNFTAYNRVSWLFHGINAMLLYLSGRVALPRTQAGEVDFRFIAVRFFAGTDATFGFAVGRALGWFPAQNDTLSLLFSLLSLLLLDVYLTSKVEPEDELPDGVNPQPEWTADGAVHMNPSSRCPSDEFPALRTRGWRIRLLPVGILLSFFCSIGSKEMGYITMPIALLLMWHRGRLFRTRCREESIL